MRLSKLRVIEIGVAVGLTLAAVLFVAWKVWAAEPGVAVSDAWARPTIGDGRVTAAYMTLTNQGGDDDVLKSVSSDQAKMVEVHQSKMTDDGIMQMRPVEGGLAVPAGGAVKLDPGGYHLMVMGLGAPLAVGDELKLTLDFEKAGPMEVVVPVRQGAMDHSQH